MKQLLLFMGFISGLLSFWSCQNSRDKKVVITDSTGAVQTINRKEILLTIPTIENTFPDFEETTDTNNLKILEDDWRQIEFISKAQKNLIHEEIDSITYIFEHEMHKGKDYSAFKKLHVRRLIRTPIFIPFDKILILLADPKKELAGVSVSGNNGQVKNGFSLSSNGMNYYGLKDNKNNVTVFCLSGADSDKALAKSADRVSKFLGTENLFLVDWIHRKIVDENNIKELFTPKEDK